MTAWKIAVVVQAFALVLLVGYFAVDRLVIEDDRRNLAERLTKVQERASATALHLEQLDGDTERRLRNLEDRQAALEVAVMNLRLARAPAPAPPPPRRKLLPR